MTLLQRFGIITALALAPMAAFAAGDTQSITVSPTTVKLELPAGGSYAGSIDVRNSGDTDFSFSVSANPYSVSGEDYNQSFVLEPDVVDATRWFHLVQSIYPIKTSQKISVPYEIRVPTGVGPGGYYAVMFAETKGVSGSGNIKSKKRVGVIFYLTVSGAVDRKGSVASFQVPSIHPDAPLRTTLRVKNDGNAHFDADINLQVKDIFGNTKAVLAANKVVMPKTIRKIELDWAKAPGFGLFRVEGTIKYNDKTEILPTRYTLMLSPAAFVVIFLLVIAMAVYAFLGRGRRRNVSRR